MRIQILLVDEQNQLRSLMLRWQMLSKLIRTYREEFRVLILGGVLVVACSSVEFSAESLKKAPNKVTAASLKDLPRASCIRA